MVVILEKVLESQGPEEPVEAGIVRVSTCARQFESALLPKVVATFVCCSEPLARWSLGQPMRVNSLKVCQIGGLDRALPQLM